MSGIIEQMQTEIEMLRSQVAELKATIEKQTANNHEQIIKSQQQHRDKIIERAKDDVTRLIDMGKSYELDLNIDYPFDGNFYNVKFIVNKEKRTVVALAYIIKPNDILLDKFEYKNKTPKSRGIAKCAPTDCFNVHIGKAIALRRALGLHVPYEYRDAPQPTEVRVGDIVDWGWKKLSYKIADGYRVICLNNGKDMTEYADIKYARIIDDSRENIIHMTKVKEEEK
ncbi:hypothetical protein NST17_20120 [Caldifermentibacillus hisashii]|uniref:Uncharacterized protein n=1 Tax=Caldifermentibacillus hisashii TaxID=996558 RepID=A0ABU9K605_9BACI